MEASERWSPSSRQGWRPSTAPIDEEAPEALMPFRLTRELRDAFGPHAVATTFQAAAAHALRSLQAERASRELELLPQTILMALTSGVHRSLASRPGLDV